LDFKITQLNDTTHDTAFATIYNYFRDVNDLVFLCVEDFLKECEDFVDQRTADSYEDLGV